jgi:hypothetical protein
MTFEASELDKEGLDKSLNVVTDNSNSNSNSLSKGGPRQFHLQNKALQAVNLIRNDAILSKKIEKIEVEFTKRQLYSTDDPLLADQLTYHYDVVNLEEAWDFTAGDSATVVQVDQFIQYIIDVGFVVFTNIYVYMYKKGGGYWDIC